ncbi:MAG: hypothetical protein [Caudoviricetes sp.]|nr:MAG: hypothetical protein [Caudoviricetes sp.]
MSVMGRLLILERHVAFRTPHLFEPNKLKMILYITEQVFVFPVLQREPCVTRNDVTTLSVPVNTNDPAFSIFVHLPIEYDQVTSYQFTLVHQSRSSLTSSSSHSST